jgi:hypothetical protein
MVLAMSRCKKNVEGGMGDSITPSMDNEDI